jgi:hypothetical protein
LSIHNRFKIGDLVTRDGSDIQRVIAVDEDGFCIEVECIKPPALGWCKAGETEYNLARRYEFAGDVIDATASQVRLLK